jgi:glycine betaine/proline transport system substrate-binding protein
MTRWGPWRWLVRAMGSTVAIVALGAAVSSCAGSGSSQTNQGVVRLAQNAWSGSRVDAAVAAVLLHDELGYAVEIAPVDEYEQWDSMATGALHACLEVWPSGHAADIAQYIRREHSVATAGPLGVVGKIGWYVPTYVLEEHPELASWEGFSDPANAALFRTEATGEQGQFLAGDPTWVQFDAQIIANLGLDFAVVFAGSEEALLAQVDAAYGRRQPILFYFWTPHAAHLRYDLTEVRLPPYNAGCYARADTGGVDCDYPNDVLFKIVWPDLAEYAPAAYDFITRFHWSTEQQTELLAAVDVDGLTPDQAARQWIATHEDVWRQWLP